MIVGPSANNGAAGVAIEGLATAQKGAGNKRARERVTPFEVGSDTTAFFLVGKMLPSPFSVLGMQDYTSSISNSNSSLIVSTLIVVG